MRFRVLRVFAVAAAALFIGCGGGGGAQTPSGTLSGQQALPLAPTAAPVAAGAQASASSNAIRPKFTVSSTARTTALVSATLPSPYSWQTNDVCLYATNIACIVQGQSTIGSVGFSGSMPNPPVTWNAQTSSGLSITFSPVTTSVAPFTSNVVVAASQSAPVGQGLVTLTPTCGSNCGQAPMNFGVLCALVSNDCPALQIVEKSKAGSPVVSGSPPPTTNAVLKKNVELVVQPVPRIGTGIYSVSSAQWTIAGVTNPTSVSGNDVTFNWTTLGQKTVSVSALLTRSDNNEVAVAQTQALFKVMQPCEIVSQTEATSPSNRARRLLGVGEGVVLKATPDTDITWEINGPGSLDTTSASPSKFTAGDQGNTKITLKGKNCTAETITFNTIRPTGIRDVLISGVKHTQGRPDIGATLRIYLTPDTVSFTNIQFLESDIGCICTGVYAPLNGMGHGPYPDPGAVLATVAGFGAPVLRPDYVYSGDPETDPPFAPGSETFNIPNLFVFDADPIDFTTSVHYITLDGGGTLTLSKAGASASTNVTAPSSNW